MDLTSVHSKHSVEEVFDRLVWINAMIGLVSSNDRSGFKQRLVWIQAVDHQRIFTDFWVWRAVRDGLDWGARFLVCVQICALA
jgi:hypothetical protein